ncbi:unnamed protein product, partial [marine sediment metagenome]
GNPARKIADLPPELRVEYPETWELYEFPKEKLKKYLPHYVVK